MTDERKRSSVGFWAIVIPFLLPVMYVASFGPACWIVRHLVTAPDEWITFSYQPLMQWWWHGKYFPQVPTGELLVRYANLGSGQRVWVFVRNDDGSDAYTAEMRYWRY